MLEMDLHSPVELWPGESDDYFYKLTLAAYEDNVPDNGTCLPSNFDDLVPGPFLGVLLSSLDIASLTGEDVVTVLRAQQRQTSHYQAGMYAAMAETAHCVSGDTTERSSVVDEYAVEEIGAALSYTRRKTDHDLTVALGLRLRLPAVQHALELGEIDARKAALLSSETNHLDVATARDVVENVLEKASNLTTGQLKARLSRLCMEADPVNAQERMEYSLSQRKVVAEPNPEGTAALIISESSPDEIYAARDHINTLARRLKTADESRSIDQIRADVALALLTGRTSPDDRGHGSVSVHIDMTTLARLDEKPGELAGCGPIVAELARKVALEQTDGKWNAIVTDPETGEPLQVVSLRRRPSAKQIRTIRALHTTCTFVGCRMPAGNCDIDHIIDYAKGGKTVVRNHAPLCRRHHMAKHVRGWRYRKLSRTYVEWLSPLGHLYRTGRPP
jgi:Domain of unknown function (DUF222)